MSVRDDADVDVVCTNVTQVRLFALSGMLQFLGDCYY